MTVKDEVGRTRYVAFRVEGGPLSRGPMSGLLPEGARLTRFDGEHGIARCIHTERDALVERLTGITRIGGRDIRIVTLATSGTIRKVAQALPPGAAPRAPKPRQGANVKPRPREPKAK